MSKRKKTQEQLEIEETERLECERLNRIYDFKFKNEEDLVRWEIEQEAQNGS